jgi:GT2 family glycosyltransferase
MKTEYSPKDVSIIIPTYNRAEHLKKSLSNIAKLNSLPREILIIDQTIDDSTKKVFQFFNKKLKILKYFKSNKPSIAIAKNIGVSKSSPKSSILLFLDDDALVGPKFINEILNGYKRHPNAAGIFGANPELSVNSGLKFKLTNLIKGIFLLGPIVSHCSLNMNSPYGNKGWKDNGKEYLTEWFPGTDPSYKKEVFKDLKFDENFFGWSLGEDIDISYRICKKHGPLYIVPASIFHKHPPAEYTPQKEISKIYMNQINHFYLFYKDMPEMRIQFIWNLIGISLFELFNLLKINKAPFNSLRFKHYIKSLYYCYKNKEKIKKGDLSLPIK